MSAEKQVEGHTGDEWLEQHTSREQISADSEPREPGQQSLQEEEEPGQLERVLRLTPNHRQVLDGQRWCPCQICLLRIYVLSSLIAAQRRVSERLHGLGARRT